MYIRGTSRIGTALQLESLGAVPALGKQNSADIAESHTQHASASQPHVSPTDCITDRQIQNNAVPSDPSRCRIKAARNVFFSGCARPSCRVIQLTTVLHHTYPFHGNSKGCVCGGGGLVGASFATTCFLTPQIDRICNFFVIDPGPSEGELYVSLLSPSSLCYLTTKKKSAIRVFPLQGCWPGFLHLRR